LVFSLLNYVDCLHNNEELLSVVVLRSNPTTRHINPSLIGYMISVQILLQWHSKGVYFGTREIFTFSIKLKYCNNSPCPRIRRSKWLQLADQPVAEKVSLMNALLYIPIKMRNPGHASNRFVKCEQNVRKTSFEVLLFSLSGIWSFLL